MNNKKVEGRDSFSVTIYRRRGNKASVVFGKNGKVFYKLGAVEEAEQVAQRLRKAIAKTGKAELVEMRNTKGRRWVAEFVSTAAKGVVVVWELSPDGTALVRFGWQGPAEVLQIAFK